MINLNPLGRVAAVVGCRKPPTAASPGACWENRLGKPGDRDHEVVPMVTQADARGPRGNYPGDQHEIYCRHACSDRANGGGEEGEGIQRLWPQERRDSAASVAAAPCYFMHRRPSYPSDPADADSDLTDATRGYPPDSTDDSNSLIQIAFY